MTTSCASVFRTTAFAREGTNARVTWTTAPGRAYVVQRAPFSPGLFLTNFQVVSPFIPWTGAAAGVTNYLVPGGAAGPSSAYRVQAFLPPAVAADDASQAAYGAGWSVGGNGGLGFGAWVLNLTGPGSGSSGNINTGSAKSWGMRAGGGKDAEAIRPFTLPLAVGSTFSIDMDNGTVSLANENPGGFGPGKVGFSLRSGNTVRFELFISGTALNYSIDDGAGPHSTGIPFTDGGLRVALTVTGAGDTYSATVTRNGGAPMTFNGPLRIGSSIDNVRLYNRYAGSAVARELYFNSLGILP